MCGNFPESKLASYQITHRGLVPKLMRVINLKHEQFIENININVISLIIKQ